MTGNRVNSVEGVMESVHPETLWKIQSDEGATDEITYSLIGLFGYPIQLWRVVWTRKMFDTRREKVRSEVIQKVLPAVVGAKRDDAMFP